MSDPTSAGDGQSRAASTLSEEVRNQRAYFRASLNVIFCLLPFWFLVSYGCGILFRDWLDEHAPSVGNAPFGFWMAQQGSIICFVLLLIVYAVWMKRLDRKYRPIEKV
ncbi:DUF4212 domain-containing protein [Pelagicoccus sp. SDUM812003]|uniref:DUF4212 domain-containing protein n=1 Tax=Pelagicoccus sp. SDUM812003 TaxID=3041267 RepID=UPI00280E0F3E|nr:DUF4212 domain-containing protein [Pelagicoccus sp. SDUM812003]MDQ8203203.1 DUF4212 domain-containing protein [Pelagicoccus sp. SDUM812003]